MELEFILTLLFVIGIFGLAVSAPKKPKPEKQPDEVIEIRRYGGKPMDGRSIKVK